MKIALVGNMNNNLFSVTRYLRDMGYDARLFYRNSVDHFNPHADTYSTDYKNYCKEISWLDNSFLRMDAKAVKSDMHDYDFYIGQGDEAAAIYKCGFNLNVYYPYGSDVYKYAYLPQEFSLRDKLLRYIAPSKIELTQKQMRDGTTAKFIRGAIVNADNVFVDHTNQDFEKKIKGLQLKGNYEHVAMPFLYTGEYDLLMTGRIEPKVDWRDEVLNLRNQFDLLLLYHGRQEWKTVHNDFTGKNTHYLILGFADFIRQGKNKTACLLMLEYGSDVIYSKRIIAELGIEANVKWLPKMYRKEIMYLVSLVDLCAGEFGKSYITYGTIVEAMLMGKPVMHHRDDTLYANAYTSLYPMIHANTRGQIAEGIDFAVSNKDQLTVIGDKGRRWVKEHFIKKPLSRLQRVVEQNDINR